MIKGKYIEGYSNLSSQYNYIKDMISKIDFQDDVLKKIKEQIVSFSPFEDGDIYVSLKKMQDFLTPIAHKIQKITESIDFSKPLNVESTNTGLLDMKLYKLNNALKNVIRDIKSECLENDWDEPLLKIVDSTNVNTLLLEATSQPLTPKKTIEGLLKLGANPFFKLDFDETPFSKAVAKGKLELAKLYLQNTVGTLREGYDATTLGLLQKLVETPDEKIFCEELAQDLHNENFTNLLGLNSDTINICRASIREGYEELGCDSRTLDIWNDSFI